MVWVARYFELAGCPAVAETHPHNFERREDDVKPDSRVRPQQLTGDFFSRVAVADLDGEPDVQIDGKQEIHPAYSKHYVVPNPCLWVDASLPCVLIEMNVDDDDSNELRDE